MNEAIQLALRYYQEGNLLQAERVCKEINQQQDNAEILHLLGIINAQLGKYDLAIKFLKKTLQYSPTNADIYHALGIAFQQKGLTEEAIHSYQKATVK
jgi:tetratricopeptide (TPR) repeat protein